MTANQAQIPEDPADIERAIKQKQAHLAQTVNELMYRSQPKQIVESAKSQARNRAEKLFGIAKEKAALASSSVRAQAIGASGAAKEAMSDPDGQTRPETKTALAAAATSAVLFLGYLASRRK